MSEKKEVVFDVDGYDAVTSALKELLNQFPLLGNEKITFSSLGETKGISFFPVSGAIVESQRKTITGKIYEVCQYPFFIVYRSSGLSESRKVKIKERLDSLGKWLEQKEIEEDGQAYRLKDLPPLTENREFISITRNTPAYLDNTGEDKTEDWVINISARYKYEYNK